MQLRRFVLPIFILLLFPLYAENYLSSKDIPLVMDQLFELHIDKDEMSTSVLARSLKIYLTNFDPSESYLLHSEAKRYLHPSSKQLEGMLADYHRERFSTYFALNETIQKSIYRARQWRAQWERSPQELVAQAQNLNPKRKESKGFASSERALRERHHDRLVHFIAFQMEALGEEACRGREAELVALCEKQISQMENGYLGLDDQGQVLDATQLEHTVFLRTLKALAHSLDAHTAYYSPDEAQALKVQLEKGMCGIGVVLKEGIEGVTIHEIVRGGPAEKSGKLSCGDAIIEVNGTPVKGFSFHRVMEIMRGREGSQMELGIRRFSESESQFFRVKLTRKKITLDDRRVDVEAEPFGDGVIGKITLHSFYESADGISSEKDLKEAIASLKKEGPLYGLVLDMRENSGGFLTQAVKVTGLFISSGVAVISKYSDGTTKYYRVLDGTSVYEGPLTILISRGSASATEIVAQTLQDYGVAIVVGDEQTYGKGTIQHQTVTSNKADAFFKVTVGRYYTVSGKSTQIQGVKSDIFVPSEFHHEEIGEGYLDYPLPADRVAPAFEDTLADIDPFARKWFQKYYLPTLQVRETKWKEMLPILKANSHTRLEQSRNYQFFLEEIASKELLLEPPRSGSSDLQMDESVNIVKDMIFLAQ